MSDKEGDEMVERRLLKLEEWRRAFQKRYDGNGDFGDSQKLRIMWRIHVWLLCSASAIMGSVVTILVHRMMK